MDREQEIVKQILELAIEFNRMECYTKCNEKKCFTGMNLCRDISNLIYKHRDMVDLLIKESK